MPKKRKRKSTKENVIYTDQKTTAQQIVRSQESKPIRVKTTTTHTTKTKCAYQISGSKVECQGDKCKCLAQGW